MKNKRLKGLGEQIAVRFKKFFYKNRLSGLKRLLTILVVGGLAASLFYVVRHVYIEYAVSMAHVSLLYPEIADAKYPDGSRFTYYDFISDDKIEKALDIVGEKDLYRNFTSDDLRDNFHVYSYLDNSAQAAVSSARSEGKDYSYVANEYRITFVQPHDYKNKNILKKFIGADSSSEFLTALMEVNKDEISNKLGISGGFANLTDMGDTSSYDYRELVGVYKGRINALVTYLNTLERNAPGFVSKTYNKSIKDLVGEYRLLFTNKLDSISSFIDTSAISKDIEVASNKLKVNIENDTLKYNKYTDKVNIHKYAQEAYDHTFTENLIVVTYNKYDGLYQARPKTAFDDVVDRKHDAIENSAEYSTSILSLQEELLAYSSASADTLEYKRLMLKCDELWKSFADEYESISKTARTIVSEYADYVNKSYLSYEVEEMSVVSKSFVVKIAIAFILGIIVVFIWYIAWSLYVDKKKMRARERMLIKIQNEERGA